MNRTLYQTRSNGSRAVLLRSALATQRYGAVLVRSRLRRNLWLLRGPLGSGKTTLVRGAVRALGYRGRVTSPTFSLVNIYPVARYGWRRVAHIDAYRIRHASEIAALGLDEALDDPTTLVIIEWPSLVRRTFRRARLVIELRHHRVGRLARHRFLL